MVVVVKHVGGQETVVRDVDSVRVVQGVLQVRRAKYNGGVHEVVQWFPVSNIESWKTEGL